jgi:phage minor structural protein
VETEMALVHILDKQTDEIVGTLNMNKKEILSEPVRKDSLNSMNTFDFIANALVQKSRLLEKRNRLIIQDEDGFFREYIITYAEQNKRDEKHVRSDASFSDLVKAKVIEPQVLTGATSVTAVELALDGTEWTPGSIEFTDTQSITIDDYTNPLALLQQIASTFGLEIAYRVEIVGSRVVGRYVDMRKQIAGFEGKEIAFAKDLVGVIRKEDGGQVLTALLGVGPEREDGTRLTVLIEDDDAFQRWGRNGQHLIEPFEASSIDADVTLEQLQALTETELKKRIDAIVSYECEAVSLEHTFGREHEKIRIGQTVRIKDDGYQPPLYVEGRIEEVEVYQATGQIKSFKIGNFVEYRKEDLEKQVALLKQVITQKASKSFVQNYSEKKKVVSDSPPSDTTVIWIKPDPSKNVDIAYVYNGTEWSPITTTSASDIVEGAMLLDRSRGGTLILGGLENGNGRLIILNEQGESIADLDAKVGGFDKLFVGDFNSPTVSKFNNATLNFYVDPAGNDSNDGLTSSTPKQTIQSAINLIPKFNNGRVNIYCKDPASARKDYWGNVNFDGFVGSGEIYLEGIDRLNYINGSIVVDGCSNEIYIRNFTVNYTGVTGGNVITAYTSNWLRCQNLMVYGQNTATSAWLAKNGSKVSLGLCEGYDVPNIISSQEMSAVHVDTCKGLGTDYGLLAQWGGWIYAATSYPSGSTASTLTSASGGITLGTAVANNGVKGTVPVAKTTKNISVNNGDNWSDLYGGWNGDGVRQGNYGYGNRTGAWFFGTSILDTIGTGRTISAMRVWINRKSSSGRSSAVRHSIRYHGSAVKPTGNVSVSAEIASINLAWGQGGWATVDPAYFAAFATGTAKGVALYTSDGSNYSACTNDCLIEITYQ